MYIIVAGWRNGSVTYFGPFPNRNRAEKYAESLPESENYVRHHVAQLVGAHNVIREIHWKREDEHQTLPEVPG